jgi:hypothetical protein
MFPFSVEVTDKIRQWGEEDAANLRRIYPQANIDTEQVIRCKAICKGAMSHYVNKDGKAYLSLTVSDIYGKTDEQIQAIIDRKVAINKKSAGARAVSKKYGKESAERIIKNKTGKNVNLQD